MSKELFVVKGTGLALDGSIVVINESIDIGVEGYVLVSPPNSLDSLQNTMVRRACLQPLANRDTFRYSITIKKVSESTGSQTEQGSYFEVKNARRDVSVESIREFLEANLSPILKMED